MREDMFKVIVERPRWAHGATYNRAYKGEVEDLPSRLGMKRSARGRPGCKHLNENLQPLRRYLWKQRGRPWDKVFSEISANLDASHTVKQHVRDHLEDFVLTNPSLDRAGHLQAPHARRGWPHPNRWAPFLYVDPRDGILKESAKLWRKQRQRQKMTEHKGPSCEIKLSERERLLQIKGIWYRVGFEADKSAPAAEKVFDLVTRERVPKRGRHAASKRQLSKAELAEFGLSNGPPSL